MLINDAHNGPSTLGRVKCRNRHGDNCEWKQISIVNINLNREIRVAKLSKNKIRVKKERIIKIRLTRTNKCVYSVHCCAVYKQTKPNDSL